MNIEEQIRAIVRDELGKSQTVDVAPKTEPDPGEGWRLVDTTKEEWNEDVEYWSGKAWLLTSSHSPGFAMGRIYRRRIKPQYREPTNADIGKMVEVSDEGDPWYLTILRCVLTEDYDKRFATEWDGGECFTWKHARIRCDGGEA